MTAGAGKRWWPACWANRDGSTCSSETTLISASVRSEPRGRIGRAVAPRGATAEEAYPGKASELLVVDAVLTLSSKGQLVIPARLRQLLGLQAGDRLMLSLEPDGLRLVPEDRERTSSAHALIGCTGYEGPPLTLAQMDPARFAKS